MKKMTINEFKNYVILEAKKLYKIEILKEEKQKIENLLSEIDYKAMKSAKEDIKSSGEKFQSLGKNNFEKNINKNGLKKAMSPEKMGESDEKEIPTNTSDYKEQPGYIHEKNK